MNISKEITGELTASVKIELTPADYQERVNKILKDYQRKANIPGFRPGHVPFGLINKQYGLSVKLDEINKILSESLGNYLEENKIDILGNPLPDLEKTPPMTGPEQENFEFYFEIGLSPKFELTLSPDIEVDYYNIKVEESQLDIYVDNIRKRHGTLVDTEVSDKDDTLEGDICELDENDGPKEGGHTHKCSFNVSQIHHENGIKKFIGLKKDDIVDFLPSETFAHGHEYTDVLGISQAKAEETNSKFRITVTAVKRTIPAEIGEDLFMKIYPQDNLKTEADLRAKIKTEVEKMYASESEKKFMADAIKKITDTAAINLPEDFLKKWLLETNKDKINEEQMEQQFDSYMNSLRWQLIENRLITNYQVDVSQDEVKEHIRGIIGRQYFPGYDDQDSTALNSIVETVMKNKEEVKRVYEQLYDEKLAVLFKENMTLKNTDVSYEEFIKLVSQMHE